MKSNILCRFAFKDLNTHRKDTIVSMITLICIALFCILITTYIPIFANQRIIEIREQYGTHDYFSPNTMSMDEINRMQISLNGKTTLLKDADVKVSCTQSVGYSLTYDNIEYITGDYSIIAVQLQNGHMPLNENEIVVKEDVLEKLGYENTVGTRVQIPYYNDTKGYLVGEWKLVGIIDQTGSASIIVGEPLSNEGYQVYIDTQNQLKITNAEELGLESTIDSAQFVGVGSLDFLVTIVQFVLFIIGCMILSGITIASFENRKDDYALLRGIGATKRQLYFVVFLQACFFIIVSLIIASLLSLGIIFILDNMIETIIPIQFQSSYFLGIILIVCLMTFISYFMPARGACRRALTGSFEGAEFQYFYYRYKKLHRMRPFYLGWRQLVNHKKQMIVKIFLIFIATLTCMNMISQCLYSDYMIQHKKSLATSQENNISLKYTPAFEEESRFHVKDFDVYKPYAESIHYFRVFEGINDFDYNPEIYCFDENVKEEFLINDELKKNNIIVSRGFLEKNNIHKTIEIDGIEYQVSQQVIDDNNIFIVMFQEDFEKYSNINEYNRVTIHFKDIHQKTKGLIAFAGQKGLIRYNCQDSLIEAQEQLNFEIQALSPISVIDICIVLGASFIYIYQLSYEIIKQREIIATYQLLGLRKFEIWKIYAYKSILIAFIGFICSLYYHFVSCYLHYNHSEQEMIFAPLNMIKQVAPTLLLILVLIGFSLLPIYSILRKDGMENRNIRE